MSYTNELGEYFTFHPKKSSSGINKNLFKCPTLSCKYSCEQNVSHYHCKLCEFVDANCNIKRRKAHLNKKHNIIFSDEQPGENVAGENPHETRFTIPFSHESQLITTETVTLDHLYCSNITCSATNNDKISDSTIMVSPSRQSVIKKSKVSTPLSSHAGNVMFGSLAGSPLFHKTRPVAPFEIPGNVPTNQGSDIMPHFEDSPQKNVCFLAHCRTTHRLKPLLGKKFRVSGNKIEDWDGLQLLCTYFRVDKVDNCQDLYVCHAHWKQWYNFNYRLRACLGAQSTVSCTDNLDERALGLRIESSTTYVSSVMLLGSNLLLLFEKGHLGHSILQFLDCRSLVSLMKTCKSLHKKLQSYLSDDTIWKKFLLQDFLVDRALTEMSYKESYLTMCKHKNTANTHFSIPKHEEIDALVENFKAMHRLSVSENGEIGKLFASFGFKRKPTPLETLVFFTASCLKESYNNHQVDLRNNQSLPRDFRVGAEIKNIPFSVLLFDIVLTGIQQMLPSQRNSRHVLFKLLLIDSIRHKISDQGIVTPVHKVLSNDISLTCSKGLMTLLNRCGLSYSYTKDIKDSQIARQLWVSVGLKNSIRNTPSNMHWIEMDNLETMLKCTTIHNAERLTHFLTSQLEFIPDNDIILDLYQQSPPHLLNMSFCSLTPTEKLLLSQFLQKVKAKCHQIHQYLDCDEVVEAMAQSSTDDNTNVTPIALDDSICPTERVLTNQQPLDKSKTVFLRMDKLCSNSLSDIKKFLDMTSHDYGLDDLQYIPSIAMSPLLFASTFINNHLITSNANQSWNNLPPIYSVPWGFLNQIDITESPPPSGKVDPKNALQVIVEKLRDQKNGIFTAIRDTLSLINYVKGSGNITDNPDGILLTMVYAELLRKVGRLNPCIESLWIVLDYLEATCDIAFKSTLFPNVGTCNFSILKVIVKLNLGVCLIQMGKARECLEVLRDVVIDRNVTELDVYHKGCLESLRGCALASLGDYQAAIEKVSASNNIFLHTLPQNHTILASSHNQLGVMLALNDKIDESIQSFDKALEIFAETTGKDSHQYILMRYNKTLISSLNSEQPDPTYFDDAIDNVKKSFPAEHPISSLTSKTVCDRLGSAMESDDHMRSSIIWDLSFVFLFDHPLGWVDYPPISQAVIIGADHQVWAHIARLMHTFPFRFSWIAGNFLGSFHKLGNLHEKLLKRYGKFHLEKHAVAFLDDPTAPKVQYLLKMKDFDACNQFYYHDIFAGIIELLLAYNRHISYLEPESETSSDLMETNISDVRLFCLRHAKEQPALKLVVDYLLSDGLAVLGLLEAQKFSDFDLDQLFTKVIAPLQFTTRGTNYGPALVNHLLDMASARPHTKHTIRKLWVANKSTEPGHGRPQDQNLEALFNNSAKNCFKLGTVQNVLNKASMIQEREICHRNLQEELSVDIHNRTPNAHNIRSNSLLRLRACWFRGFEALFSELKERISSDEPEICLHALHNSSLTLNPDIVKCDEIGRDRVSKYIAVKIEQENGWRLQNPSFSEILSVSRPPTARQQRAALNNAQHQIETMATILLDSAGLQVTLSETSKPLQLLKADGKSLHFSKKADLTQWLFQNYEHAFCNEDQLAEVTRSQSHVSCMIRDCMFDFRKLQIPTCSYKEMTSKIFDKTVLPIAQKYANADRTFTLIQTFDRRADQTKGSTEVTRASAPVSPLEYSGYRVDENELIKSFSTKWLDRDNGRQKIITTYTRMCQNREFLMSKKLPSNFQHVVIGGNCGIFASYAIDRFGNISFPPDDYSCLHPEADTVVFFALNNFLTCNPSAAGSSIIMSCPEADNVTILLLEHHLISNIIDQYNIKLFCTIHNKTVDVKSKKPTKKPKESSTVPEFAALSSKVKIDFFINVFELYRMLTEDFTGIEHPVESLGALSIHTGNDKSPGIRNVTKKMALSVYREACKKEVLGSLVDSSGKLSAACQSSFRHLLARIYFHMYRVLLRKLDNITWESIVASGNPNFKILRDLGYRYSKGKLDKVPPVDGALAEMFNRSLFQAQEYDQIFERRIHNLDPEQYGFEKVDGGLRPRLNRDFSDDQDQFVANVVDNLVTQVEETESVGSGDVQELDGFEQSRMWPVEEGTAAGLPVDGENNSPLCDNILDSNVLEAIEDLNCSALLNLTLDINPDEEVDLDDPDHFTLEEFIARQMTL